MNHGVTTDEVRYMLRGKADQLTDPNMINTRFLPGRMRLDPIYRNAELVGYLLWFQKPRKWYLAGCPSARTGYALADMETQLRRSLLRCRSNSENGPLYTRTCVQD